MAKTRNINIVYRVNKKELEQATAATEKARKSTQDLGKQLKETESVGTRAFNALGAAVAAVGIGALVKKIVDLGAAQQQLNIAFTTFLGDATKAKKLIAELTQFSIVTPFTPDQVNKAAKSLLAFGVQGKDIIKTLKMLGDVSAGTGKDLAEMAIIFGQIRSTGRLMGQDLLQLINAGFNPLQVISQQTGRSVADLKKDMENGLITFEDVSNAFKTATSEGGLFFNLMEKQSKSIGGLLSTVAGNIEEIQKGLFESNIGLIDTVVTKLTDYTAAILQLIKVANSDPIFEHAQKRVEEFTTALDENGDSIDLVQQAIEKIKKTGDSGEATNLFKDLTDAINEYESSVDFLVGQIANSSGAEFERLNTQLQMEQQVVRMLAETRKKLQEESVAANLKFQLETQGREEQLRKSAIDRDLEFDSLLYGMKEKLAEDANKIFQKIIEDDNKLTQEQLEYQYDWEFQQLVNKNNRELKEEEEANQKKRRLEEQHQEAVKQLKRQAFDYGVDLLGQALFATIQNSNNEEAVISERYNRELELAAGNQESLKIIRGRQERDLEQARQRQAQKDKDTAIKQMAIQNLLNSIRALGNPPVPNFGAAGLALAYGFAQISLAKTLGFKDGVIDLKGPGNERSDSIPAMLSKGESVMTAKETDASMGILKAIRAKKLDDRIFDRIKQKGQAVPVFNDGRIVSAIEKSRINLAREGSTLYNWQQYSENLRVKTRAKIISR